ncbi:uncharacterized protein LOC105356069 isoform X2 [Oryzias latipes]
MTYFRFLRKRSIGSRCAERFGSAGWSSAVAFRILCWKKDLKEQNKEEDLQPFLQKRPEMDVKAALRGTDESKDDGPMNAADVEPNLHTDGRFIETSGTTNH